MAADFDKDIGKVKGWARDLRVRWDLVSPYVGTVLATDNPEHALDSADVHATTAAGEVRFDDAGRLITQLTMSREQLRVLRMARGYSHEKAAEALTGLAPALPKVSRPALERVERLGVAPQADRWLSRLDMVYRADGRLGIERAYNSAEGAPTKRRFGTAAVTEFKFPEYWVGPVWLQASSDRGRGEVASLELTWGPWRRRQRIRSGQVVTMRKARLGAVPLQVELPAGWHFVAGTGAAGTAWDINDDWQPRSLSAGRALLSQTLATLSAHRHLARALSAGSTGGSNV